MKYFLDAEFIEHPGLLQLISIGIKCEDGREYYAISSEFDEKEASDWVKENVLPILGNNERKIIAQIKNEILEFIGNDKPEFWGYYADFDWVLFAWIFGRMIDLPKGWPMFCLDLKQSMYERGIKRDQLPKQPDNEHNALEDAKWVYNAYRSIYE